MKITKKISVLVLVMSLFMGVLSACSSSSSNSSLGELTTSTEGASETTTDKLSVYTTIYPMYYFAQQVGGDKVEVNNMIPTGVEPHDWEPDPQNIVSLEKADIFVYNGAGLEHWVPEVLSSIKNKNLVTVEACNGIQLLDATHDHDEEEHDADDEDTLTSDPHVWLAPENAKKEAENIKNAFIQRDSYNREFYENNFNDLASRLDTLNTEYQTTLEAVPNKQIVVSHAAFGYLCQAYGLTQVAIEGLSPDSEPDAARMSEIVDFVKANNIKVIFFEELVSPKVAQSIAKETGASTAVLNPLEGLTQQDVDEGKDYISIMEENLQALKEALS